MAEGPNKQLVTQKPGEMVLISPYFLNTPDSTRHVQTPILLNDVNYERWSKLFLNVMRTKRKLGFLDGSLQRPEEGTGDAERWDMVNSMMIGWIYASVEPKLRSSISLVNDASIMWSVLRNRYSSSDGTKQHQLHADLTACKQEGNTVEDYFARLKIIWDTLADVDKGFSCCCGQAGCPSMVKYRTKQERLHIHQFLMGLSTQKFGTTRSNLLTRIQYLSLDAAYSSIRQEECHVDATTAAQEKIGTIGFSATFAPTISKQSPVCTHCGWLGHEKSQCFKIIGYPEWFEQPPSNSGRGSNTRGSRGSYRGRGNRGRNS